MNGCEELQAFVLRFTRRHSCTNASMDTSVRKGPKSSAHKDPINLVLCKVGIVGRPDRDEFLALTQMAASESCAIDPLDGDEHSYKELDSLTGDLGTTLRYMALGTHLGVFNLVTPANICSDPTMVERLAAFGYLGIRATEAAAQELRAA